MSDKITRLRILKAILEIIRDIADAIYQEEVWIKKTHSLSDFNETMCHYFDDFHVREILDNYKEYGITEVQKDALKKFTDILDEYSDTVFYEDISEEKVMEDPKWVSIRIMAKDTLFAFNYPNASQIVTKIIWTI